MLVPPDHRSADTPGQQSASSKAHSDSPGASLARKHGLLEDGPSWAVKATAAGTVEREINRLRRAKPASANASCAPVAYQPGLMRAVAHVFADSRLRWYTRRLAPPSLPAQGGLLNVIQRCSGDLRWPPTFMSSP